MNQSPESTEGPLSSDRPCKAPGGLPALPWPSLTNIGDFVRKRRLELGYKSQEKFSLDHGISTRVYQKIESHGQISKSNMFALGRHLQLDAYMWTQFYFLVTGELQAYGLTVGEARTVGDGVKRVAADWAKIHIHRQESPSAMIDGLWNVEHFNAAWARLFDSVHPHPYDHPLVNLLRFFLFHPDARRIFVDWEERWLVPILCNFAHQYYLHPENADFQAVRDRIRRNAHLEDLYQNRIAQELAERGTDRFSGKDEQERRLLLPGGETLQVLVTQATPWFGRRHGYGTVTLSRGDGSALLVPGGSVDMTDDLGIDSDVTMAQVGGNGEVQEASPAASHSEVATSASTKEPAACRRCGAECALSVGRLVRHWREKTPYSQEQFPRSTELPFSDSFYAKLERDVVVPKKEDVSALSEALRMPAPVKRLLLWMVTRAEPPTEFVHDEPEAAERTHRWFRVHLADDRQPSPSVLLDGAFNVVYCNSAYRRLFAHVPADPRNHPLLNPFRYVVFHEDAKQTLDDWYEVWLVPWLVELGLTLHQQQPTPYEVYQGLYHEIEAHPFLRETFNGRVMRDLQGGGVTIGFESDGDIRGMNLPVELNGGTVERRLTPMLVTAGIPRHLREQLCITVTPQV